MYQEQEGCVLDMKFVSDDIDSISLHDCDISEFKFGEDIELIFEDGFDIASPNPLNGTGRHKRTGKAAVVLKKGQYVSGEMSFGRVYNNAGDGFADECRPISENELSELQFEVLAFKFEDGTAFFVGDSWKECNFCELKFVCANMLFCWNEFTDDAWFQDYENE